MTGSHRRHATAFAGTRKIAEGSLAAVTEAVREALAGPDAVLVFDDETGAVVDLDPVEPQGPAEERVTGAGAPDASSVAESPGDRASTRGRGRPRLGVVPREVTLLPRHWEWLEKQPGGISAALRRLVDQARRGEGDRGAVRDAQAASYHFMSAMAGDLPGFEEAVRALFAREPAKLADKVSTWPKDIAAYSLRLAGPALNGADEGQERTAVD
ncbi:DUF2239 family protein [Consotaella salsifontis]|uniref:DUF2239 domain-containing protein n=1 Tax=Consotaella salsifontis TaxID=1365950 RepID=A0A1T4R8S0_9HYPH|nr:DUF2239 family protein [Consotaella salsifontis]SKA12470.1 hypothetical protein SAMN05428963_106130 [Consotaella salsifontis]